MIVLDDDGRHCSYAWIRGRVRVRGGWVSAVAFVHGLGSRLPAPSVMLGVHVSGERRDGEVPPDLVRETHSFGRVML